MALSLHQMPEEPSEERHQLDLIVEALDRYGAPGRTTEHPRLSPYGRLVILQGYQCELIQKMWALLFNTSRRLARFEGHPYGLDDDPTDELIDDLCVTAELRYALHKALIAR